MKKLILGLITGFLLAASPAAYAVISSPPILPDSPTSLQHYLADVYNAFPVISGNWELKTVESTTAVTATNSTVIFADGTFTVTLQAAASFKNRLFFIKNIGTGTVTVDGNSSETIDGATTQALAQNKVILIISDGTEWWILADNR